MNESVQPVYSIGQLIVILCGFVESGTRMHMEIQDQKGSGQQVVDPGYTKWICKGRFVLCIFLYTQSLITSWLYQDGG